MQLHNLIFFVQYFHREDPVISVAFFQCLETEASLNSAVAHIQDYLDQQVIDLYSLQPSTCTLTLIC